ncbi:MAG: SDR family oxidoreductase [Myxococcales bacterium]|nr:SDR family oxidoreductase [Myxococcales bacterium]USN50440.1 MAG: SDR family oxidoreductase [Myxococcales bacterium]
MSLMNLCGKTALVTGVADNVGFGWHIAKVLKSYGARVILSTHPRVESILERYLTKEKYRESRILDDGSEFKAEYIIPCDVALDSMEELDTGVKEEKGYKDQDVSLSGLSKILEKNQENIDIVIHSVAFSPEIERLHLDVSRQGYLKAMSVSSYSLVALTRCIMPFMKKNNGSIVALSYIASERAVPFYGGGMASAKAALECDARMLSWQLGEFGHRINIVSAGPYPSRAAKSIGDVMAMVEKTKANSPLRRAITPEDVANAVLFLASDLSRAISGEIIHVDSGFHAMALV